MNKELKRVSIVVLLMFLALFGSSTVIQVLTADDLRADGRNSRTLYASYSAVRGPILVDGQPIAESVPTDDEYKFQRTYTDGPLFAPVTGYFTLNQGNTGIDYVHRFESGRPGPHVMINALTHGNEFCGMVAACHLLDTGVRPLIGTHDFSTFRAAHCQAKSPVKLMHDIQIRRQGDLIIFTLKANAFLHHMVRNLVGSLVYIGQGREDVTWMGELLAAKNRQIAAPTFMPDGLYLAKIDYDEKWALPQESASQLPWF